MANHPNTVIIGRGKVGQSMQQLFELAQFPVKLIGRSKAKQRAAVAEADITILSLTDQKIEPLCSELAPSFKPGSTITHCSGALSSEILLSARKQDCYVASTHPLNTFPSVAASLSLFNSLDHGTTLFAEGDTQALDLVLPTFKKLGFRTLSLNSKSKPVYHAACVIACNYLTTLMELSLDTAEQAGIDRHDFWFAIQPLIQATLSNISEHDTTDSLSGPIARGDVGTIKEHLSVLNTNRDSYKRLGLATLKLAAKRGELSEQQLLSLETLLS